MQVCPLTVERERLGLTRYKLALGATTYYQRVADAESGRLARIPFPILVFLRDFCGSDIDKLQNEFAAWYAKAGESIRREMKAHAARQNVQMDPHGAKG